MAKAKKKTKEFEVVAPKRPLEIEVEQLTTRLLLTNSVLEDTKKDLAIAAERAKRYGQLLWLNYALILLGVLFYLFYI